MTEQTCIVVIPTWNEVVNLPSVIADLDGDLAIGAIWIVDGGSRDGTRALALALQRTDRRVRLIDNPDRTQAAGVNLAARHALAAGFDRMVRVDAHARYAGGYVSGLCAALDRTGADSVTVPRLADPAICASGWQRAAARLQGGWLGHGGAAHRRPTPSGWVDHGHHAAFRLARFVALGGYDPRFRAAEDVDFDTRLRRSGGRIWFAADLPVRYQPRASLRATFAQMRRNGRGRLQWARKHRRMLDPRQMLPVLAQSGLALSLTASVVSPGLALPGLAYLALVTALAARSATGPVEGARITALALTAQAGFALGVLDHLAAPRLAPRPRPLPGALPLRSGRGIA